MVSSVRPSAGSRIARRTRLQRAEGFSAKLGTLVKELGGDSAAVMMHSMTTPATCNERVGPPVPVLSGPRCS